MNTSGIVSAATVQLSLLLTVGYAIAVTRHRRVIADATPFLIKQRRPILDPGDHFRNWQAPRWAPALYETERTDNRLIARRVRGGRCYHHRRAVAPGSGLRSRV